VGRLNTNRDDLAPRGRGGRAKWSPCTGIHVKNDGGDRNERGGFEVQSVRKPITKKKGYRGCDSTNSQQKKVMREEIGKVLMGIGEQTIG